MDPRSAMGMHGHFEDPQAMMQNGTMVHDHQQFGYGGDMHGMGGGGGGGEMMVMMGGGDMMDSMGSHGGGGMGGMGGHYMEGGGMIGGMSGGGGGRLRNDGKSWNDGWPRRWRNGGNGRLLYGRRRNDGWNGWRRIRFWHGWRHGRSTRYGTSSCFVRHPGMVGSD
jgi:hypothetical protein